jgi:hypothetical protein
MRIDTKAAASRSSRACAAPSWCAMTTAPMKKGRLSKLLSCAASARARQPAWRLIHSRGARLSRRLNPPNFAM